MFRLNAVSKTLFAQRRFSTLVVADFTSEGVAPSTRSVLTAAAQLGKPVSVLVAGKDVSAVASAAGKLDGVSQVYVADAAELGSATAENFASLVKNLQGAKNFTHIVASTSSFNKNWLPRAAALLDVQPVADVTRVVSEDTFERPVYAGNVISTVKAASGLKMLTIRASSFERVGDTGSASSETVAFTPADVSAQVVREEVVKSERPDLSAARVVVSGGRGLKSGENFAMLNNLADIVGGAVGASRAAVDAGYVPNDLQVGQTGKIVAPEFYFAVGISGAIQHLAGMKDSKTIIAINKDADAPIFQVADYGVVGDLFEVIPQLTEKIQQAKK